MRRRPVQRRPLHGPCLVGLLVVSLSFACNLDDAKVEGNTPVHDVTGEPRSDADSERVDTDVVVSDGAGDAQSDVVDVRVIAVEASSHDGNTPEQSVDEDFATRWSASGEGEWIAYTLSEEANVSYVQIAFHRGDERRSIFDVQLSTDGTNWTDVLSRQASSGGSTELETFAFEPARARYVRIVGYGNDMASSSGWNSYLEVRVEDFPIDLGESCTPNTNACGPDGCGGQHPSCGEGLSCVSGTCEEPSDDFEVFFALDFSESPVGPYLRAHWSQDWGLSVNTWTDPCRNNCTEENWAGARLSIVEEGGNRFMRHVNDTKGNSPGTTGFRWRVKVGNHEELYLTYRVRFAGDDWEGPSYSGKLPGLCGGGSCPGGGNPPLNYEGFTTRYMFRGLERIYFYLYYAGMDTSRSNYGNSQNFSNYTGAPNRWRTVTQRVVLNSPGSANGLVEGFLDGVLVAQRTGMDFRNSSDQYITDLLFTNFLGGSGEEPSDYGDEPTNDFDDVMVYRYKDHVTGIARGRQANPLGTRIPLPSF
jgi:hypothetical protein